MVSLKDLTVTLKGDNSVKEPEHLELAAKSTGATISKLGASFAPASDALKAKYGVKSGVVVTRCEAGKIFDSLDVPKGMLITSVNGKAVNSVKDVESALPTSKNGMTTITGFTESGKYTFSF